MKNVNVVVLLVFVLITIMGLGFDCSNAQEFEIKQRIIEFPINSLGLLLDGGGVDFKDLKKTSQKLFALPVEEMIQKCVNRGVAPEVNNNIFFVSGNNIRVDSMGQEGKSTSIVLLDEGKIYNLDWANKQYMELSIDSIKEMQKRASEALKKLPAMEKALEKLPPEVRAQMQAKLGQTQTDTEGVKLTKTGRSATINGFECEEYLAETQTGEAQIFVSQEYPELRKTFDLFMKAFPGSEGFREEQNMDKILGEIPTGWPFLIKELELDPVGMQFSFDVTEILSVEKKDLPADTFRVPTDFMKVASPVQ